MKAINIILCLASFTPITQSQYQKFLKEHIRIEETCHGELVEEYLPYSLYESTLKFIDFSDSNIKGIQIISNGRSISKGGTFCIGTTKNKIETIIRYPYDENEANPYIIFKHKKHWIPNSKPLEDTVFIYSGYFKLNETTTKIKVSNACKPYIFLDLPMAGTQTDATIYKFIKGKYRKESEFTYYSTPIGSSYSISKDDKAKFKIYLRGCHSSMEFEFEVY